MEPIVERALDLMSKNSKLGLTQRFLFLSRKRCVTPQETAAKSSNYFTSCTFYFRLKHNIDGSQPIFKDTDNNDVIFTIAGGRTKGDNERSFVFVHQDGSDDVR